MKVYLLWMNDGVLGVYRNKVDAMKAAIAVMKEHRDCAWTCTNPGRWYQREGRIARLEVDEQKVQ